MEGPAEPNGRAELARHLPMHTFPARPGELVEVARAYHSPDFVIAALAGLPDRLYDDVTEVWVALSSQAAPGGAARED